MTPRSHPSPRVRYNGGRFGKKRPFIVIAALVQGITFAMLLSPPASGSQDAKFAWFLTFTVLSGLASVTLSTAYFAWAVQLTLNSGDRTWVFGMQRWFWQVGGLIGAAGPRTRPEAPSARAELRGCTIVTPYPLLACVAAAYFVKWMGGDVFTTYRTLGMLAGGLTVVSYLVRRRRGSRVCWRVRRSHAAALPLLSIRSSWASSDARSARWARRRRHQVSSPR